MSKRILLTGVTGFLGSHTAIQLLEKGYEVTGTLRNKDRAESMRQVIGTHTGNINNLKFAEADLSDPEIWNTLTQGIDFVQHIASPFPRVLPKREEDLIIPAKEGTLNVLKAASKNGVKRVVLTSSTGAIVYGKDKDKRSGLFREEDWTNPENKKDSTPYFRSKTIAEKAAWDFVKENASGMELSVVCPGAILGPVLEQDFGTSANIVIKTMDGSSPALPGIGFDMVDVRSVAELHVLAMESPQAAGERFVGSSGYLTFKDVADILRKAYPDYKIPKMVMPDFGIRIFSNFDKTIKPILIDLGTERKVDHSKAVNLLQWKPIPVEDAVISCAESAVKLGLI